MRNGDETGKDWPYEGDDNLDMELDLEIRERLKEALDAAGPSEEVQDRMLANLLAAQAEREAALDADEQDDASNVGVDYAAATEKDPHGGFTVLGGRRRGTARRALGLAVAASLLLAVLGVTVGSLAGKGSSQAANYAQESAVPSDSYAATPNKEQMDADAPAELSSEEESAVMDSVEADAVESRSDEGPVGGAIEQPSEFDPFASSGGAFDVSSDPSYDLAVGYPEIRLRSGEVLMIEEHQGDPVIIGDEWVEGFKGDADAFSEDGKDSVRCWVYLLPVSDDGLYVVRYVQEGSCYAARAVE